MKRVILVVFLVLLSIIPVGTALARDGDIAILSPRAGEGVQGRVVITGYIKASNYARYDIDFADEANAAPGWYPIDSGEKIADDGTLAIWDTSTISDSNYSLRLTVYLNDGTTSQTVVTGIRVRNYSPMEPITPAPDGEAVELSTPTAVSLLPASADAAATAANPAEVSPGRFQLILAGGIVFGLIAGFILVRLFSRQHTR
jgi:hypothetical protein